MMRHDVSGRLQVHAQRKGRMNGWLTRLVIGALLLAGVRLLWGTPETSAQGADQAGQLRDGSHDFDFNVGVWHTHIKRTLDPSDEGSATIELNGMVTTRKVWGGRALLEEIEADGPKGHWEGLSLFLYNPAAHQWGQYFINSKMGELNSPLVGEFHDGRGDLYAQDTMNGKPILVRGEWTVMGPNAHRYQESYSYDGGATWKTAFIGDKTRDEQAAIQDGTAIADPPADAGASDARDFDFDLGNWKTHSTRLLHPLTGSHDWVEMDGETHVTKVWGGRGNLAEYDATGTSGHVTLLSLRWFNPALHAWEMDFATPQVGTLGIPGVGAFKDGRADFYDFEPIGGRQVLVKFSIWKTSDDQAQSEQAFSDDGGKTWEVNWVNKYTRIKGE